MPAWGFGREGHDAGSVSRGSMSARKVSSWFTERGLKIFVISAITGEGIPPLLDEIARQLWGKVEEEG